MKFDCKIPCEGCPFNGFVTKYNPVTKIFDYMPGWCHKYDMPVSIIESMKVRSEVNYGNLYL